MPDIDIIDGVEGSSFTADLPALIPIYQKYADLVTQQWSLDGVTLHYAGSVAEANPNHWWLVCNGHSPDSSMGGFHNIQPNGLPFARVYIGDALKDGFSKTVDTTHELAEMIVDPFIKNNWNDRSGKMYMMEICDPVENDAIAIMVDGISCSNFVLPAYYSYGAGPYDYGRRLTKPCPELIHGGYVSWLENNVWRQSFARLVDGGQSRRSMRFGRVAQRAVKIT